MVVHKVQIPKMMFIVIDPKKQVCELIEALDYPEIKQKVFDRENVDHGAIGKGMAVVVYEFGLYKHMPYFAIGPKLYAGKAIIYGYDIRGETQSITQEQYHTVTKHLTFYPSETDVEKAIADGKVSRPEMRIGGRLVWQWPSKDMTHLKGILD